MASYETMTFNSSLQDESLDNDIIIDDGYEYDHHNQHPHNNLSRLSVCTSSTMCGVDDGDVVDVDKSLAMYMSGLSIENFDGGDGDGDDGDGEYSDAGLSASDSENDLGGCFSLPATPPRRRRNLIKDYASDNETQKGVIIGQKTKKNDPWRSRRCRRVRKNAEKGIITKEKVKKEEEDMIHGFSGESDQSESTVGRGREVRVVITRPKSGGRSLCMDLEEVKACRDLGFELEHEHMMMEMPSNLSVSFSNSTLDTSSGGNSPVANWRISSLGDDPRDVKARLKMWAQAVAASASNYGS